MILTVDIGNSDITTIAFENGVPVSGEHRIATANHADYAAVTAKFSGVTAAYISSVAPSVNEAVTAAIRSRCGDIDIKFVDIAAFTKVSNTIAGVTLACDEPAKVGADLVCDCVGAVRRYGTPVFIADYGTVSKFLVVDSDARYVAASFCPGVKASMNLFGGAELLAGVVGGGGNGGKGGDSGDSGDTAVRDVKPFGANTADCMLAGVVYAAACATDELYRRCCEIYGSEFKFVITGGMAGRIAPHCRVTHEREPFLTNYGIYYISETLRNFTVNVPYYVDVTRTA